MAQKKELNCVVFKSTETEQSHLNTTAESEKNAPTATSAQKKKCINKHNLPTGITSQVQACYSILSFWSALEHHLPFIY